MRVSQEKMEESHRKILQGAARLVRERGIEGTSVNDVMGQAGMKNGGFYRHFDSKDALVDAALQAAFEEMACMVEAKLEEHAPAAVLSGYRAHYLSQSHVDQPGTGCPVAALSGDVARAPDQLKASFGAGVNRMVAALAKTMTGTAAQKRERAMREFAMLVGTVVIARACDPETKRVVLNTCRKRVSEP